ncbi:SPFH domain-containing protein [Blastopirellula sp. JC732]|uniref:SPFH domain-containing protein n=1 Tax=Blastopirellula sediminis TaxID=2894196 RepID=A0A9X1MJ75_9BACT|nr:SPFH domain-containing protein [Blastopirellula sediminis]MCC9609404.1 SPFH domain-containing protein [Blastopirellula sediminis]MCC9627819.1 SPFH domain-containing protein [Blastopirellula sediminis]
MFGISYVKAPPSTHVMLFRRGKVVCEGAGLSFFYFAPTSTLVQLPLASTDVPFVFNEVTADFQDATIQGELTFRVTNPGKLATLLDFSVDAWGRYRSDDPTKLNDRLIHTTQTLARAFTLKKSLRELLTSSDELVAQVFAQLSASPAVALLGVEVMNLSVLSIKATPEMAKALQAEAREKLLLEADEAIYARRNTAVELERQIKENELNTEIAVQQKQRQVRETKLKADIAIEQERATLVDRKIENERKESEAKADALKAMLEPLKDIDWRTLLAAAPGGLDANQLIAMAFRDLADNAENIGNLNISPDLLSTLLDGQDSSGEGKRRKR